MGFKLTNEFRGGTGLATFVPLAPAAVVRTFGQPGESDEYKVSGEYRFETTSSYYPTRIFTLYEYKATSLYAPGQPTPGQFWSSEDLYPFHVGAGGGATQTEVDEFVNWLRGKVR